MRPFSPAWKDPLSRSAPGLVIKSSAGLRMRVVGHGPPDLVFVHGLGASLRYWGCAYDALTADGRLIFIDLLGFGGSAKPPGAYDMSRHVDALAVTFDELRVEAATVVGHSVGGLIAMALGAERPHLAGVVAGFGVPIFPSEGAARGHLRSLGLLARLMVDASPWAPRICRVMCDYRSLARAVAPILAPRLPVPVAADGVDHIWESYSGTFTAVVARSDAAEWAARLGDRLYLTYGEGDRTSPPAAAIKTLGNRSGARIKVIEEGDHHLPLRQAKLCADIIRGFPPSPVDGLTERDVEA